MYNIWARKNARSIRYQAFRPSSIVLPVLAFWIFTLVFTECQKPQPANTIEATAWIGTWGTAQQLVEPHNMPPQPGLSNNTLRQIVRVSLGGNRLRLRFSNEFSTSPVTLKSAHVAVSTGGSIINPDTDRGLRFDGKTQVIIEAGAAVTSDPFTFALEPRSDVAITIYCGETAPDVTGHPGSRTTSYLLPGNAVDAVDFPDAVTTDHWYIIDGIDIMAPEDANAVVVLGNSITDGRGSGTNKQNRWPDELARRLQENPETRHVAVLNMGIGGNCVLRDCLGPAAVTRFARDVLEQSGVRWLFILEGINDIGGARDTEAAAAVARDLIAAYEHMIDLAHAEGILVYGATLLPFGGSFYDSAEREAARQTVNEWIRNSGRFDAVIDLDAALRDPTNPLRLLPAADTGDFLHPNETGHRMMAEAVDLTLFERVAKYPKRNTKHENCDDNIRDIDLHFHRFQKLCSNHRRTL
ncbi:SGNH/GDSL hydrolase family protein [candidate division KSB1 bacterium]|nr:SGNH/GDSL hydrolase family protein [candidate division KSB1 bacterium]RQW05421.1 MAG: SGNH/GDSL hydrolase family protein [candidate division KSB1 bacterium]